MCIHGPPYSGIGATIRIGREIQCLPYMGFLFLGVHCVVHVELGSIHCVVCIVQCVVCTVQCVVCSVKCAVYSVQFKVFFTVQCAVCSVQCAVLIVFSV